MDDRDAETSIGLPLEAGQSFSRVVWFDDSSISKFATLVGDSNFLHHDRTAALETRFGGLIASGTHVSSVLAAMVATALSQLRPSLGLEISFRFRRAVRANTKMVARWELTSIKFSNRLGGHLVVFTGELLNSDGEQAVAGKVVSVVT